MWETASMNVTGNESEKAADKATATKYFFKLSFLSSQILGENESRISAQVKNRENLISAQGAYSNHYDIVLQYYSTSFSRTPWSSLSFVLCKKGKHEQEM